MRGGQFEQCTSPIQQSIRAMQPQVVVTRTRSWFGLQCRAQGENKREAAWKGFGVSIKIYQNPSTDPSPHPLPPQHRHDGHDGYQLPDRTLASLSPDMLDGASREIGIAAMQCTSTVLSSLKLPIFPRPFSLSAWHWLQATRPC